MPVSLLPYSPADFETLYAIDRACDVLEEHRRSGVGTALLGESERRLKARGVRVVYLETATSNEAGVAFWQRHGYRSFSMLRGYYLGRLDAYRMRKPLDSPPVQ